MIGTRKPATRPAWWDEFLSRVRVNGGFISDALRAMNLGDNAHVHHRERWPELAQEVDDAVAHGKRAGSIERANRILAAYASGTPLEAAGVGENLTVQNVYLLFERVGMTEQYERIRDARRARTKDYGSGAAFLLEQLDLDAEATEDRQALAYIGMVKAVVEAVTLDSTQLREIGLPGLRNKILRIVGQDFKDEEGFPPFLNWPEEE